MSVRDRWIRTPSMDWSADPAGDLRAMLDGRSLTASYDGYASCPLTTARDRMLLAEFDYTLQPAPSIPILNTKREHRDLGLLEKVGLPTVSGNLMLKGLA